MSQSSGQIYIRANGLDAWKAGLARPNIQWKRGRSAFELAVSWEAAARTNPRGLPACVEEMLDPHHSLKASTVLIAIPEHKVAVSGKGFPSRTILRSFRFCFAPSSERIVRECYSLAWRTR